MYFLLMPPVSGGDVGAREARLSIMVGGDDSAVKVINATFFCDGEEYRSSRGGRCWSTYKNVQSDHYLWYDDRCV